MKLNLEVKTAQGSILLKLAVTSRNARVASRNAQVNKTISIWCIFLKKAQKPLQNSIYRCIFILQNALTRVVVVHQIGYHTGVAIMRERRNGVKDLAIYVLVRIRIILSLSFNLSKLENTASILFWYSGTPAQPTEAPTPAPTAAPTQAPPQTGTWVHPVSIGYWLFQLPFFKVFNYLWYFWYYRTTKMHWDIFWNWR